MKNLIPILLICAIAFSTLASGEQGVCLKQEIVDITPSSVKVNEDFTVGIQIQGCGDTIATGTTFELKSISSDIIVKEGLLTEIESICITCKKHLTYNMRTSKDATPGEYSIETELKYKSQSGTIHTKKENFTINIISNYAELNIASLKINPTFPKKGDPTTITVRVENYGEGNANSVKGELNFEGKTSEAFLGKLDSGEDGPLLFTLIPDKTGETEYGLTIKYSDDYGNKELKETLKINVIGTNWPSWATYLLIIIAIFAIYLFLKKGRKNENPAGELYQSSPVSGN